MRKYGSSYWPHYLMICDIKHTCVSYLLEHKPGLLLPFWLWRPGLKTWLAFIRDQTINQKFRKMAVLTSLLAVSLDFSAISSAQKHWKKQVYRELQCLSTHFNYMADWPRPFTMLSIHWTAMPTACSQHLLTWEPGIPPASKWDQCLFRGGFCSSKYGIAREDKGWRMLNTHSI